MSAKITDELREYADRLAESFDATNARLYSIADSIDAEHERAMADAELAAAPTEAQLEEWGYVKLPVDADGVQIRIGDVVYDCNKSPSEKFSVAIMELNKWGWSLLDSYGEPNEPGQCHHHHAPTVEDVLREFAERVCNSGHQWGLDAADTIAEYAAKLRLAERVDE